MLILTLMVSVMALYINLGCMLYGEPALLTNRLASVLFLLVWIELTVYSIANDGVYSAFMCFYWLSALVGAAFCVIVISGITKVLEYAAYFLLLPLTPLFGLRPGGWDHFAWAFMLTGLSVCYATAAIFATYRRSDTLK